MATEGLGVSGRLFNLAACSTVMRAMLRGDLPLRVRYARTAGEGAR